MIVIHSFMFSLSNCLWTCQVRITVFLVDNESYKCQDMSRCTSPSWISWRVQSSSLHHHWRKGSQTMWEQTLTRLVKVHSLTFVGSVFLWWCSLMFIDVLGISDDFHVVCSIDFVHLKRYTQVFPWFSMCFHVSHCYGKKTWQTHQVAG